MRNRSALVLMLFSSLSLSLGLATACGGSSGGSDVATPFVGTWTFDTGMVNATCTGGLPNGSFPLAGLSGTISRVDNSHIRFQANASCIINFSVSGTTATAASGQTCTLDTGTVGQQPIAINSWTMVLTGGTMAATISGSAFLNMCMAMGTGSLTQHASDGGTGN